jgi:hypothetical protein
MFHVKQSAQDARLPRDLEAEISTDRGYDSSDLDGHRGIRFHVKQRVGA